MEVTEWNDYICHFIVEQNVLNIHYVSGTILGFRDTAVLTNLNSCW